MVVPKNGIHSNKIQHHMQSKITVVIMIVITTSSVKIMAMNTPKTPNAIIIQNADTTVITIADKNKDIRAFACADFSTVLDAGKNQKKWQSV